MKFTLILFASIFAVSICAQKKKDKDQPPPNYDKLWNLFIDEKYEQLLMKAETITEKDDRRKEPMPYLFLAMGSYEISKDENYAEDYPKAFRDALKYASKYRGKDKKYEYKDDYVEFLQDIRSDAMEIAESLLEEEKFSKAKSYYKYLCKMDPECQSSWLMQGYCQLKMNDISGGKESMKRVSFQESYFDELSSEQERLARYGLMTYAEYLVQQGMKDSARATIDLGKEYFSDDKEYQIVHEDIYR